MPRKDAQYSLEGIEYAATRAGQSAYGSDERLDFLISEMRRFLDQVDAKGERD